MNTVAQADAAIIIASCRPEDEENRQQDMMSQVALAVGYGIRQFIIVVNKMDAAWDNDADFQKLRMEIGARIMMLGRIVVNNLVPCIPVSALEDTNISNWDPSKRRFDTFSVLLAPCLHIMLAIVQFLGTKGGPK